MEPVSARGKIGAGVRSTFSVENLVNQLLTYGVTALVTLSIGIVFNLPWWGWLVVGAAALLIVGAIVVTVRRPVQQEAAQPEPGDALERAIQQRDWQEVMLLLAETNAGDWHVLHDVQRQDDGHWYRAVYKPDFTLAVEWGAVPSFNRGDPDREFEEDWSRKFPDTSARMYLVEVIFNGGIVHQSHFASVDGGRGYVPVPKPHVIDDDKGEAVRDYYYASAQDVALTRLIHDLTEKSPSFDFYMERSGIRVIG